MGLEGQIKAQRQGDFTNNCNYCQGFTLKKLMVASYQKLGNKFLSFLIVDVKEAGVFIILPVINIPFGVHSNKYCAWKWFGTYTPCKCKSHNEIYLHFMASVKPCKFILCCVK